MVTKNERDRYIETTLPWLSELCDGCVHVHDDTSMDGTFEYVKQVGVSVSRRRPHEVAFSENEGSLRGEAWRRMEAALRPTRSDWVLCIDADELPLSADTHSTRNDLYDDIERTQEIGRQAVEFHVDEVFDVAADGLLHVRIDGYWGAITARRLVRWRPGATFKPTPLGGGSAPDQWANNPCKSENITIVHLGYANDADRQAKHARYLNATGHNPRHIASILTTPQTATRTITMPSRPCAPT